jgi:16S rRNA G966 N2-methylase RsmD
MNIEQVKQFIKEVRWGFLATTDGRISCSTSVPVRVSVRVYEILRRYIENESVDLVYLDPSFKSDQDYNILFAERNGSQAAAQIKAFEDTWHWDKVSAAAYQEIVETGPTRISQAMQA